MKAMKKSFKIVSVIILALFAVLLTAPVLFKGQIKEIAEEQINANLNAKVEFDKVKLSFIKNFPNVNITLKGLSVAGIDEFEGDTLVSFNSLSITVDIMSVIDMKNINIRAIILDNPNVMAKVLKDGKANWDIVKETPAETEDTTASETPDMNVSLKKFEINNATIVYDDESSDMLTKLEGFNFKLTGDMSKDLTTLVIHSTTEMITYAMDGIKYLNKAQLNLDMNIDADMKNGIFTFTQNEFSINKLVLGIDGKFEMPEDKPMSTDMTFHTKQTDFKTLLSLIPAIYKQDFEDVQTQGTLKLDGKMQGQIGTDTLPNTSLDLKVTNANFKYPSLPKSVEDINIDLNIFWDGINNDNSIINLTQFHLTIDNNPVDMKMKVATPMSDPSIDGMIKMELDLATISDIVPLEKTTIKGMVSADISLAGLMSAIESEQYQNFKAKGKASISGFEYSSPDISQTFKIKSCNLSFSPQYLQVTNFDASMGQSDFKLSGKLENYIPYMLKDETIKGDFLFVSDLLDINELMSEEEVSTDTTQQSTDSTSSSVVEIPGNIDMSLRSELKKILYDNYIIDNLSGTILIKDKKMIFDKVLMNMFSGTIQMNGEYNTVIADTPKVNLNLKLNDIDVQSVSKSFLSLQELIPIVNSANGKVSSTLTFDSPLDKDLSPILPMLHSEGTLYTKNIVLSNAGIFNKIGDLLNSDKFDRLDISDMEIGFIVEDGRVKITEPFDIKFGKTIVTLGGDQGLDNTLNYSLKIAMPRGEMGAGAVNSLAALTNQAGINISPGEMININGMVKGTFSDPKVTLNLKETTKNTIDNIKQQLTNRVKEEVDVQKQQALQKASEEAKRIIAAAEKEAEVVRSAAKASADAVRKEGKSQAQKLIDAAKNPIAKKGAQAAATKMEKEADNKANKIESEADAKAKAIIDKAKAEAEKLNSK